MSTDSDAFQANHDSLLHDICELVVKKSHSQTDYAKAQADTPAGEPAGLFPVFLPDCFCIAFICIRPKAH